MTIDVKNLMNKIINDSIDKRASDIHIYPDKSGNSFIKLRVNGHLSKYEQFSNRELEAVISLLKFNSNIDISRNKEPQSGRFVYNYNEKDYFLRVSTLPLSELNEGCVVRIFINELEDVDYSIFEEDSEYINDLSKKAYGLVLFSGPTGSGKSTSMYKLANELASKDKQVITVEDPVEKHISSLIQMQVNEKAGINYDNALKSILRCDPDAMVIGEIRDYKTASQVVTCRKFYRCYKSIERFKFVVRRHKTNDNLYNISKISKFNKRKKRISNWNIEKRRYSWIYR